MMNKKEKVSRDEIVITPPTMTLVNNRLLVMTFGNRPYQDPVTKIWSTALSTVNEKSGKIKEIPRFFVAKTSNDLPVEGGELPIGTEVFPFIPPAEDFFFPQVFDPGSQKRYIMLEWLEITGYILPNTGGAVSK